MHPIQPIEPTANVNNYNQLPSLHQGMLSNNDKTPDNALPIDSNGTIQSNAHNIPQVVTYNAHGILNNKNPNSLIAYA